LFKRAGLKEREASRQSKKTQHETTKSITLYGEAAVAALPEIEKHLRGRRHFQSAEAIWRIAPARAKKLDLPDVYIRERHWWN